MLGAANWPLILEFVKTVSGPLATLIGAIAVARLALSNFRTQKAIERRLDWYEKIHSALHNASDAYERVALADRLADAALKERWQAADTASRRLAELCNECWLYAHQSGFEAVNQLRVEMATAHAAFNGNPTALADAVTRSCIQAASRLSADIRSDLGMRELVVHVYKDQATGRLAVRGY